MSSARQSSVLGHLSNDDLTLLINRYYAGESIPGLLRDFGVGCKPRSLWRHFPPLPTGQKCAACGAEMIELRPGRTRSSWLSMPTIQCCACDHRESRACTCKHCSSNRAERTRRTEEAKRQAIQEFCAHHWRYPAAEIQPEQLSAHAAIALLSVVRAGGWLDSQQIGPLATAHPRLAPTSNDFAQSLVSVAMNEQLIAPSPDSPSDAFHGQTGTLAWKLEAVNWRLTMPDPTEFIHRLEQLVACEPWPDGWSSELLILWHALAVAECWEFCTLSMEERSLPMPGDTALRALLDNLLRDHSASQVFQHLWSSGTDAVDFIARKRVPRQHAANFMIGACQRRADRARAEGWTIKGFQRNFQLPRTQISHVLHDVFLGHGEHGFTGVIPQQC